MYIHTYVCITYPGFLFLPYFIIFYFHYAFGVRAYFKIIFTSLYFLFNSLIFICLIHSLTFSHTSHPDVALVVYHSVQHQSAPSLNISNIHLFIRWSIYIFTIALTYIHTNISTRLFTVPCAFMSNAIYVHPLMCICRAWNIFEMLKFIHININNTHTGIHIPLYVCIRCAAAQSHWHQKFIELFPQQCGKQFYSFPLLFLFCLSAHLTSAATTMQHSSQRQRWLLSRLLAVDWRLPSLLACLTS